AQRPFHKPALPAGEGHHRRQRPASRADDPRPRGRHGGGARHQQLALQHHHSLARPLPAWDAVGGRPRDGDAVPHPPQQPLHLPLQRHGAGGHAVVARAQLHAPCHRPWRHCHQAQERRPGVPFPQTRPGADRYAWRVVERQRVRPGAQRLPHGQPGASGRRLHHQRQAGGLAQVFGRQQPQAQNLQAQGAERLDVPAPDHQRGGEHAHVLQGRRPQLHGRGSRRGLHGAVRDRRRGGGAGADRGRAHGHGRRAAVAAPLLHDGLPLQQRAPEPPVQEQHRHSRRGVRRRRPPAEQAGTAAAAAGARAHHAAAQRHGDGAPLLHEPGRARPPGRPCPRRAARRRHAHARHHRAGARGVQAGADAVQRRQPAAGVRRQHEQRLLRAPRRHVPPGGALQERHGGRLHAGLPRRAAPGVRLHQAAARHEPRDGQVDQGQDAAVQRHGGGGAAGHGAGGAGEPPHAPPRPQLLRAGAGVRQLPTGNRREAVQPRQPAPEEHPCRADGWMGCHSLRCQQP
ncbi:hypothetical protein ACJX0J_019400, partial [Zea mays]